MGKYEIARVQRVTLDPFIGVTKVPNKNELTIGIHLKPCDR